MTDGQLETHVPDHMIAQASSQGNPVFKRIHGHRQCQSYKDIIMARITARRDRVWMRYST